MWEQYLIYLGNLLRGEFGHVVPPGRPVSRSCCEALPNTLVLTLVSLIVAYAFGIVAGALLAFRRGGVVEAVAIPAVLATRAAPEFWLGMLLLAALRLPARLVPDRRRASARRDASAARRAGWSRPTTCGTSPCPR